jgi:hypothetical protein
MNFNPKRPKLATGFFIDDLGWQEADRLSSEGLAIGDLGRVFPHTFADAKAKNWDLRGFVLSEDCFLLVARDRDGVMKKAQTYTRVLLLQVS